MPSNTATVTALQAGAFGNGIALNIVLDEGGSNLIITVVNELITLTVGTTGGTPNITWDAITALVNADPDASALVVMTSDAPIAFTPAQVGLIPLTGGTAGLGAGQFYSADASPPPGNIATASCVFTVTEGSPQLGESVGCFELIRVVATMRPARHLPVRGSNK